MATKEISQLPSTNVSNDTDLLMTRQGAQDRAVAVENVRNIGTESGQALGVGGYGIGGNAVEITSIFASNNTNLINRTGVYRLNSTTNSPVSVGELKHYQISDNEATQEVVGQNQEAYFRKKVAGTWLSWVLYGAANKETVRQDLNTYDRADNLSDVPDVPTAQTNLNVYDKSVTWTRIEADNRYGQIPAGTRMLFQQTSAPPGWVKDTTANVNNKALRVVSGTVGSGGANSFTSAFNNNNTTSSAGSHNHSITVQNHTLTINQIPSHDHLLGLTPSSGSGDRSDAYRRGNDINSSEWRSRSSGGNQGHNHGAFSGSAGNHAHTFNLNVQYIDLIVAVKQ